MFSNIGTPEIIVIGVLLVVLFGSKKIVELARGLGESTKELKRAGRELKGSAKDDE